MIANNNTKKNLQKLKNYPVEILIIGDDKINIKLLLKILGEKKIKTILLEGGGTTTWEFIKNNFVDEFLITLTPFILGGKKAISLVQGEGFTTISKSSKLRLNGFKRLENDLVLNYSRL